MENTVTRHIKKIDHVVMVSADINSCIRFYQTLGFSVADCGSRYELYAGDFKINVHLKGKELLPNAHIARPGTLDLCLEVEGTLDVWFDLLNHADYEVSDVADKHGVKGTMRSFYVRDPDLNLIELCSYE